ESPVNEGRLCPKGANTLQFVANAHRVTTVKYRAPYSDRWEEKPLDWAMDRIARLVKEARDRDFVEQNAAGVTVNHLKSVASLGGGRRESGKNSLIKNLSPGGWAPPPSENRARL